MSTTEKRPSLNDIVALCKRRGFIFPSSEIYGGLPRRGTTALGRRDEAPCKRFDGGMIMSNCVTMWVGMDTAITCHPRVWEASGHVGSFNDPLITCKTCGYRFRADKIDEEMCPKKPSKKISECGGEHTEARDFNLMFKLHWGPVEDEKNITYLRPETCQALFVNFKNITTTMRQRVPFGIAQVGKSFRNEITTKAFIFRQREFEQMELEYFVHPEKSDEAFEAWKQSRMEWYVSLGVRRSRLRMRPHEEDELAHYARACVDVEYEFPMGWQELEGIANRTNYDLSQHSEFLRQGPLLPRRYHRRDLYPVLHRVVGRLSTARCWFCSRTLTASMRFRTIRAFPRSGLCCGFRRAWPRSRLRSFRCSRNPNSWSPRRPSKKNSGNVTGRFTIRSETLASVTAGRMKSVLLCASHSISIHSTTRRSRSATATPRNRFAFPSTASKPPSTISCV